MYPTPAGCTPNAFPSPRWSVLSVCPRAAPHRWAGDHLADPVAPQREASGGLVDLVQVPGLPSHRRQLRAPSSGSCSSSALASRPAANSSVMSASFARGEGAPGRPSASCSKPLPGQWTRRRTLPATALSNDSVPGKLLPPEGFQRLTPSQTRSPAKHQASVCSHRAPYSSRAGRHPGSSEVVLSYLPCCATDETSRPVLPSTTGATCSTQSSTEPDDITRQEPAQSITPSDDGEALNCTNAIQPTQSSTQ